MLQTQIGFSAAYHSEDDEGHKRGDEEVESHVEGPDACHPDGVGGLLRPDALQQPDHRILPPCIIDTFACLL